MTNKVRVSVYRNLNRKGVWYSMRRSGIVSGYFQYILLENCEMKHATPKQLDEVRTGARQVCQWINGDNGLVNVEPFDAQWRRLKCDPKKADGFRDAETGVRVDRAKWVRFHMSGEVWYVA